MSEAEAKVKDEIDRLSGRAGRTPPIAEHDLEPPDWLSETPPTADVAEATPEPEPPPTPEPEPESPAPELELKNR